MAIISCPECGKSVSDKAISCPGCGYPIAKKLEYVLVKLELADTTQSVSILDGNGNEIWTGKSGETAQIGLEGPTEVTIKYKLGIFDAPKACRGIIDANLSRKWLVKADNGRFSADISLQPVDSYGFHYVTSYEYQTVKMDKYDEKKVTKKIENLSKEGWEYVSILDNSGLNWTMIFKRPLTEAMPIVIDHIKP